MSKIMNLITYDKLLKNITAIHINLICSDTFKILYEAAEKTASFMICFSLLVILLKKRADFVLSFKQLYNLFNRLEKN